MNLDPERNRLEDGSEYLEANPDVEFPPADDAVVDEAVNEFLES